MLSIVNIVLSIWNTILRGLVIKIFWGWFILNLFPTFPVLQILPAIGLSYFVGIFSPYKPLSAEDLEKAFNAHKDPPKSSLAGLISGLLYSFGLACCLLGGWIVHCFM